MEGDDPEIMHQKMAATLEECVTKIRAIQVEARSSGVAKRPKWYMIVFRSPKGWTGPKTVDGHKVEGFWRAHQVPMGAMHNNPEHLEMLEEWMKSYKPEELFDENGTLIPELKELSPKGDRRMSSNPITNGGKLRKDLNLPDFRDPAYAVEVVEPGKIEVENTKVLGYFLRDVMANNMHSFRVFGPDETASNRLNPIYEVSKKVWMADYLLEDEDGGELSPMVG